MKKNTATKTDSGNPRADSKNPNNPASKAAQDNRSRQLNPEDPQNRDRAEVAEDE